MTNTTAKLSTIQQSELIGIAERVVNLAKSIEKIKNYELRQRVAHEIDSLLGLTKNQWKTATLFSNDRSGPYLLSFSKDQLQALDGLLMKGSYYSANVHLKIYLPEDTKQLQYLHDAFFKIREALNDD